MRRSRHLLSRLAGTVGLIGILCLALILASTVWTSRPDDKPISDAELTARWMGARQTYERIAELDRQAGPSSWRIERGHSGFKAAPQDLPDRFKEAVIADLSTLPDVEFIGSDFVSAPHRALGFLHDRSGMSFSSGWLKGLVSVPSTLPARMLTNDTDVAFAAWQQLPRPVAPLEIYRALGDGWYIFLEAND